MIMSLTGVDEETASAAFLQFETVEEAIDSLLTKPAVSGDKYIPPKPTVKTGLTPDQEALCKRGRWLQDQVNVVFSVAHSKTRTQSGETVPEVAAPVSVPVLAEPGESQPGSLAQTSPPSLQSESPPQTHSTPQCAAETGL